MSHPRFGVATIELQPPEPRLRLGCAFQVACGETRLPGFDEELVAGGLGKPDGASTIEEQAMPIGVVRRPEVEGPRIEVSRRREGAQCRGPVAGAAQRDPAAQLELIRLER